MTVSDGISIQIPGVLRSGTKEYLLVNIGDRIDNVDDLTALTPTFNVYDEDDAPMQGPTNADIFAGELMTAQCLIDTSSAGGWPSGKYRLFLSLSAPPEAPILGLSLIHISEPTRLLSI